MLSASSPLLVLFRLLKFALMHGTSLVKWWYPCSSLCHLLTARRLATSGMIVKRWSAFNSTLCHLVWTRNPYRSTSVQICVPHHVSKCVMYETFGAQIDQ